MNQGDEPLPDPSTVIPSNIRVSPRVANISDEPRLDEIVAKLSSHPDLAHTKFVVGYRSIDGPMVSPVCSGPELNKRRMSKLLEYDPVRHAVLFAGPIQPPEVSSLIWLDQRSAEGPEVFLFLPEHVSENAPSTEISTTYLTSKVVLDTFAQVKERPVVSLKDRGLVLRGRLEDVMEQISTITRGA